MNRREDNVGKLKNSYGLRERKSRVKYREDSENEGEVQSSYKQSESEAESEEEMMVIDTMTVP